MDTNAPMLTKTYKPIALRGIPPFYSSVRDGYPGEKLKKYELPYKLRIRALRRSF
jgi:hypothetical protein